MSRQVFKLAGRDDDLVHIGITGSMQQGVSSEERRSKQQKVEQRFPSDLSQKGRSHCVTTTHAPTRAVCQAQLPPAGVLKVGEK